MRFFSIIDRYRIRIVIGNADTVIDLIDDVKKIEK